MEEGCESVLVGLKREEGVDVHIVENRGLGRGRRTEAGRGPHTYNKYSPPHRLGRGRSSVCRNLKYTASLRTTVHF